MLTTPVSSPVVRRSFNPDKPGFTGENLRLVNVFEGHGTQILRVPPGTTLKHLTLAGGATWDTNWPAIEGAVLKFNFGRSEPITIDWQGLVVPAGFSLMDKGSFDFTVRQLERTGQPIVYQTVNNAIVQTETGRVDEDFFSGSFRVLSSR